MRIKHWVMAVLALSAVSVWAGTGVTYKGSIKFTLPPGAGEGSKESSAQQQAEMQKMMGGQTSKDGMLGYDFKAEAQSGDFKMTYETPFFFYPKGSYILGTAKGQYAYMVFPERKEYVKVDVNKLQAGANHMQKSTKMKFSNLDIQVSDLPSKTINGYKCVGKRITLSYDVETHFMLMHHKSHDVVRCEYYSTPSIDAAVLYGDRNWHNVGLMTGNEDMDRQISKKVGFLGFPIKVVTVKTEDGKDAGKSILTTKDIKKTSLAGADFALPSGYQETSMAKMVLHGMHFSGSESSGAQSQKSNGDSNESSSKKKHHSLKDLFKKFGGG